MGSEPAALGLDRPPVREISPARVERDQRLTVRSDITGREPISGPDDERAEPGHVVVQSPPEHGQIRGIRDGPEILDQLRVGALIGEVATVPVLQPGERPRQCPTNLGVGHAAEEKHGNRRREREQHEDQRRRNESPGEPPTAALRTQDLDTQRGRGQRFTWPPTARIARSAWPRCPTRSSRTRHHAGTSRGS